MTKQEKTEEEIIDNICKDNFIKGFQQGKLQAEKEFAEWLQEMMNNINKDMEWDVRVNVPNKRKRGFVSYPFFLYITDKIKQLEEKQK